LLDEIVFLLIFMFSDATNIIRIIMLFEIRILFYKVNYKKYQTKVH